MKKLSILLVTQNDSIKGGSDVVAFQSKLLLERLGHNVTLFCSSEFPEAKPLTRIKNIDFDRPNSSTVRKFLFSIEARKKITLLLATRKFDIAYLHIYYGKITSAILKPLFLNKIPIVQHLHEFRTYCPISTSVLNGTECSRCRVGSYIPALINRCNKKSFPRSFLSVSEMYLSDFLGAKKQVKHFIAVSEYQRKKLITQGLIEDTISTIYNSVAKEFSAVPKKSKQYVLFAGRVEVYKGIYDFIEIAARLENIEFIVAGDGSELAGVRRACQSRDLSNVLFLGKVSRARICELLSSALVSIVPSKWGETFGLAAAESLAAGVPVIAYNNGGLPEVLGNGDYGFVVNDGDVSEVVQIIKTLEAMSADEYSSLSRRAKIYAEEKFSEVAFITSLESVLLNNSASEID